MTRKHATPRERGGAAPRERGGGVHDISRRQMEMRSHVFFVFSQRRRVSDGRRCSNRRKISSRCCCCSGCYGERRCYRSRRCSVFLVVRQLPCLAGIFFFCNSVILCHFLFFSLYFEIFRVFFFLMEKKRVTDLSCRWGSWRGSVQQHCCTFSMPFLWPHRGLLAFVFSGEKCNFP